jgi:uncharacterized protein
MNVLRPSKLRFNFGFLLEADFGTSRLIELDYPAVQVAADLVLTPLQGAFTASRTTEGIYIRGELTSTVVQECIRCLEEAILPIDIRLDELFYYPTWSAPPGELVIGDNGFIDLAPLIRELSLLEIPTKPLCRADCQGLCQECGANLNEGDCGCVVEAIDPRLAPLQQLLNDEG